MSDPVFNKELDVFCRKYLLSNRQISPGEVAAFPQSARELNASLFEQLLLFDTVGFKVHGENIALSVLISLIGLKGVEQLIEENALKFVLWTQDIFSMVTDIHGVHPLAAGTLNSEPHYDPEKSAELGLRWLQDKLPSKKLKRLVAKVTPLYEPQPDDLATNVVAATHSAYQSGRLLGYGLDPEQAPLENVPISKRELLQACSSEIMEYKFLLAKNWSSFSNYTYFYLLSDSLERLTKASGVTSGFKHLAEIANLPDFGTMLPAGMRPLRDVPKFRAKRSSRKFRTWLASGGDESPTELTRRYVDDIANAKGFFDRAPGKVTKAIAMTAAGAGLGAAIEGGLEGAALGAMAGKLVEPLGEFGLDLIDAFLLDDLLRGWNPRMFLNLVRKNYGTAANKDLARL